MELRQLKTFLTVTKLGSFVQSAGTLGYSQAAITNHIQALENELGAKLFERLGHRVTLTNEGQALLPYAEQIVRLADEALAIANNDAPQGKLIIGTNESLGTYRLPDLLQAYRGAYPKVEMILKFANCDMVCEYIRGNKVDVGVIINNRVKGSDFVVEEMSSEQMLFLVSADHFLAQKEMVAPHDLAETCVILTEPGCSFRLTTEKILKDAGVVPQSILEASSIESIKQLIMLGLGISMLPRFTVEKELSDGRICAVRWAEPIPPYTVQLLYHKDKWLSPNIQALLQLMRGAAPQRRESPAK